MPYTLNIEPIALQDVQQAIDYYDDKQPGLGEKFEAVLNDHLIILENNPFFQVRYGNIHCLPIKKYPYMIHFTIDESNKTVNVVAVFNTNKDPKAWKRNDQ